MLRTGIVGLPNVGKSTLFNAMTRTRKAEAANYPFCTIAPNIGVVEVPDERLQPLAKIAKTTTLVPAAIEIVDIAGLVAGASSGEGLGNQFLSHIREVDAIVHLVRCFDGSNIVHNMGGVDPVRDIEVINTELILADLQSVETQLAKNQKKARSLDKAAQANLQLLERVLHHLDQNRPASTLDLNDDDQVRLRSFCLLSSKPMLYACNVDEVGLSAPASNPSISKIYQAHVNKRQNAQTIVLCVKLESELAELDREEAQEFLSDLGFTDSGVTHLIRSVYDLLGLASYFTAGEKEAHAWTFKRGMTAPQCAGIIHSDFEKGFIKAEIVAYKDLIAAGSLQAAREAGKYRLEGKDYRFVDGDVALFRFST